VVSPNVKLQFGASLEHVSAQLALEPLPVHIVDVSREFGMVWVGSAALPALVFCRRVRLGWSQSHLVGDHLLVLGRQVLVLTPVLFPLFVILKSQMCDCDVNVQVLHLGEEPLAEPALVLLDLEVDGLDVFGQQGLLTEGFVALSAGELFVLSSHVAG